MGPHIAPVHAELDGTTLRGAVYDNAVHRADAARNPRVAFTTWKDGAVATSTAGRGRSRGAGATRPGRSGAARRIVTLEVALTLVYAMRAP